MKRLEGPSYIILRDEKLSLIRNRPTVWVDGIAKSPGNETLEIEGNVQPVEGRDLQLVPEGDRFKENLWLFTYNQVLVNDLVLRNGVHYQVQTVENWGSFRECRMTRKDVGYDQTP